MSTATVITDWNAIHNYRLCCIRSGLRMEVSGMRCKGASAATRARQELTAAGFKPARSKAALLTQFVAYLKDRQLIG